MQQYIGRFSKGSSRIFIYHKGGGQYRVTHKQFNSYDTFGKSGRKYNGVGIHNVGISGLVDVMAHRIECGWKWKAR